MQHLLLYLLPICPMALTTASAATCLLVKPYPPFPQAKGFCCCVKEHIINKLPREKAICRVFPLSLLYLKLRLAILVVHSKLTVF